MSDPIGSLRWAESTGGQLKMREALAYLMSGAGPDGDDAFPGGDRPPFEAPGVV